MVDAVVSFVVERLGDLLIQEAALLNRVSHEVKQLQVELNRMQCFLKDADKRQVEDESVRNWVSEIRNLAFDAEDFIELYALKVAAERNKGIQNFLNKCKNHRKIGHKIEHIKSRISDLTRSLQTYGLTSIREREDSSSAFEKQCQLRWSYSHIVEEHVVGLEDSIKKLVAELVHQNSHYQVVSICGMGGLGKTTLAKKIYHDDAIRRYFEGFAWAYISQQCKKRDVWQGILLKLANPSKEERDEILKMRDEELAKRLHQIQKEKRCIIVLDDIWNIEAWDILSSAFPSEDSCSKIVLTTRNKEVAVHADREGLIHEPICLNDDESWELFQRKAFPRRNNSEILICNEMNKLGREMVAKCAGLPLAIIVLGGLLATKDVFEWATLHKYITSYLMRGEVHETQSRLAEVLALSYHDLPSQLKPCFLYLGHFPEDFDIPIKKLIRLWVAEGLVSSQFKIERDEPMEDIAERFLANLINRCMVQVGVIGSTGRIKTCQLHDLMRDLCLSKAREENFLDTITRWPENEEMGKMCFRKARRLSVFLDSHVHELIPSNQGVNAHLRSLIYFHERKCSLQSWRLIKSVFDDFKLLRVLDLEGIKGSDDYYLPKEIGNLLWLKFFSLKQTRIKVLPSSLGNLEYLQTLNLQTVKKVRYDSAVQIANVIWKLRRLRHLYLPNWCVDITDKLQLANLSNLQTLVNFPANKCNIEDLLQLRNLRKLVLNDPRHFQKFGEIFISRQITLGYLRSLSLKADMLSFPDEFVDLGQILVGCPHLHKLHVEGRLEKLPEHHKFPPNLAKLILWGSKLKEDPMQILEKLPNLKFLSGWEMFTGKKMVCSQNGFPQLKSLLLRGLPYLEKWMVENQAMANLSRLSISDCNKLRVVPDGMRFVSTLRELEIRWMPQSFKNRLGNGGEDFHNVQHVPFIVFLN